MSTAGSLAASLLATLVRPTWWALGLAAFLVRGGFLVLLLPIVQLPTTAGLANLVGPTLVGFVFAGPSASFVALVAAIAGAIVGWLILGGLAGAALDLALIQDAARDEDLDDRPEPRSGDPVRAVALRLVAHVPTAIVLVLGAVRLVDATYQELIRPGDPGLPIPLRVALRIPETVAALGLAWLAGEAVGGLAIRYLAWGEGMLRALVRGVVGVARPSGLAALVATNGVVFLVAFGAALAAGIAWDHLRIVLVDGATAGDARLALLVFSLTWVAGTWLVSLAATWRGVAWTFEVARRLPGRDDRATAPMTARGPSAGPPILAP